MQKIKQRQERKQQRNIKKILPSKKSEDKLRWQLLFVGKLQLIVIT